MRTLERKRRGPAVWVIMVLVLAMIAAACGGTADEQGEEGAGDTTEAAPTEDGGEATGEPVQVAVVAGMSGAAAVVSEMWDRGIRLAIEHINAEGGVLGRPLEAFTLDTRTEPPQSVAAMRRALERDPYVVFGTVFSSSTIVNMDLLAEAGVPQFTGSESPGIWEKQPTHLFAGSANAEQQFDAMKNWFEEAVQPETLALIYVNNEFGQGGRDALVPRLQEAGVEIVQNLATEVGQADFTGELTRIQQANPDVVFAYIHEEESGRLLKQIQQSGLEIPVVGATTILADSTLSLAGDAADGVRGLVTYTGTAPELSDLGQEALEKYGEAVDHNFFKAYISVWAVKYATDEIGEFDQQKLIDYLHDRTFCQSDHPNLFSDTHWDAFGSIDRNTYIVEVEGGKPVLSETVGPLQLENFGDC